jgi:hypothetical protein
MPKLTPQMIKLQEIMIETQTAMNRNLATHLYGDNWASGWHTRKSKPVLARLKSFAGQLFLKAANALGESDGDY